MPGFLVKTADSLQFASCYPIVPCRNYVMIITQPIILSVTEDQSDHYLPKICEFKLWTYNISVGESEVYYLFVQYTVDHINYCYLIFVGNKYPFIYLFIIYFIYLLWAA
jgi:hypothetical protein